MCLRTGRTTWWAQRIPASARRREAPDHDRDYERDCFRSCRGENQGRHLTSDLPHGAVISGRGCGQKAALGGEWGEPPRSRALSNPSPCTASYRAASGQWRLHALGFAHPDTSSGDNIRLGGLRTTQSSLPGPAPPGRPTAADWPSPGPVRHFRHTRPPAEGDRAGPGRRARLLWDAQEGGAGEGGVSACGHRSVLRLLPPLSVPPPGQGSSGKLRAQNQPTVPAGTQGISSWRTHRPDLC